MTHQIEGIDFTVRMEDLKHADFSDIYQTCTDYFGNMETLFDWQNHLLFVSIVDDDGEVEETKTCTFEDLQQQVFTMALAKGWVEQSSNVIPLYRIDLGQFDPFDLGDCVQLAAFGDLILG